MLKKILAGAVLLGGLAIYISQVELKNDAVKAKIESPFSALKPVEVKAFELSGPGGGFKIVNSAAKPSAAESDGKTVIDSELSNWSIDGIKSSDLDSSNLNSLISGVQGLVLKDGISAEEAGTDKGVYGLAPAAATLKVTTGDDRTRELTFGKVNEYVGQRYLQIAGDSALYLVPSTLFDLLVKPRDDFRNRLPLIIFEGDVKQLTLSTSDTKLAFEQSERWRMSAPKEYSVSSDVITEVFRAIRAVRATSFIDDADSVEKQGKYGLTSPELVAQFAFKDEKRSPIEARFGRYKDANGKDALALQIAGKSAIVLFNEEVRWRVIKPLEEYRDRKLASFATYNVKSVVISKGESKISLSESSDPAGGWLVDGKEGDQPFVTGYFDTVSGLEAKGFLESGAANLGFDAPYGTIEITMADGATRKVVIGNQLPDGKRAVGVDKLTEPFTVDEAVVSKLLPAQEVFVKVAPAAPAGDGQSSSSVAGQKAE